MAFMVLSVPLIRPRIVLQGKLELTVSHFWDHELLEETKMVRRLLLASATGIITIAKETGLGGTVRICAVYERVWYLAVACI